VLLVLVISLQTTLLPAAALQSWLPLAQRDSEGESPAPEEATKETVPSAFVSADVARARRAAADRLAKCDHVPTCMSESVGSMRIFHAPLPAEQAGRNGSGGPLRC